MPHRKLIKDKDPCFVIDANTRTIKKQTVNRKTLMQYDHNSERFSFLIPKSIEGHDMMECNKVEVHYINIDALTMEQFSGVYTVTDLQTDTEDAAMLRCSWLISQNATNLSGSLNFLLRFACVAEDGTIEYAWNTEIFTGISVTSGIYNSEVIVEQYADVLEQWKKELENSGSGSGGGGGAVSSVNGKVGDVFLSANDLNAYSLIPGINITGGGIEIHSNSDKNIILFTHRDDGSFAVHDLSQKADKTDIPTKVSDLENDSGYLTEHQNISGKADKATTLSGYGIEDAYTKDETDNQIGSAISSGVTPVLVKKAESDLSNVPNEYFLAKLNEVLPDGDEVSY